MSKKGRIFIICAPSGCGKGTVLAELLKRDENLFFSVSATTRNPRPGEVDGVNYHFLKKEQFEHMIETNDLLEYAQFVGNYYGTPRTPVIENAENGKNVILEIEIEGAKQVRKLLPEAVSVYILPPSMADLRSRLAGRGTEEPAVIEKRLARAKDEIPYARECDYVMVNNTIEQAVCDLQSIIKAACHEKEEMLESIDKLMNE